jgi:two-component system, cell cycle sensor histidine kinase PleC
MTRPPGAARSSLSALALNAELRAHHLETAARYLHSNLLPLPFVIAGLAVLMNQWHPWEPLALWGGTTMVAWAITIATFRIFLRDEQRYARVNFWTVVICASVFVSSLAFGAVSPLFWVDGDRLNNVLLYVLIAASLASAGAQSAPSVPVVISNLTPYSLMFLYLSLAHEAYPVGFGVAFLQLCYIGLVSVYVRAVWQLSDEMLRLRLEKRDLIDRLQMALVATRAAQKKTEAASRAKSEFLANMSHELRTPLNAILGFAEIIRDRLFGDATERYAEYGGHIHFSGKHLLGLIGDILDLSKIEAGKRDLDETNVDLIAQARDALRFVEQQAKGKSLTLSLDAPAAIAVRADERALRQIIANLLSNAVKFTPVAGSVTLRLFRDAHGVSIQVADTGVGIKPEDMDKVLESFGQARHDITTTEEQGTGLGLPIVKGLVELHGGTMRLDSKPRVGTTVTVTLPAERIVAPPEIVTAA